LNHPCAAQVAPALLPFADDAELGRFAARDESRLPSFQLVEGPVHAGPVVVLGDAIKAVKPYFGQGANSALEDVAILDDCLDDAPDAAGAAALFSERRAEDARALVRISRGFDGRGPLGTARFLAPLLLDAKLSKAFPRLFSPPLLRAIQNEDNSFHALRVAKRRERCAQAAALACALAVGRALCRAAFA
jgi:2-polyprenyl-6-methoxyphenol hydroxylase-like FAD-dependent oxidoreductase